MQAPLSSTASGKNFTTGILTALSPATPVVITSQDSLFRHNRSTHSPSTIDSLVTEGLDVGLVESFSRDSRTLLADGPGLAHDAGNLLGALGLYCELLALPGVLREEHRHYAEELRLLSGRSRVLIDRLLNPSTTESRLPEMASVTSTISPEMVAVPEVIESCRGLLNAVARRAIAVVYGAGAALPVVVSRESLERILVNLAKNAAEASTAEGVITLRVTCRREGAAERVVLTVEDKGCGMSSAAVKVLMGGAAETQKSIGSAGTRGIGFQVVRELVGSSGGQLRLRTRSGSGVGSGTTVEIAWAVAVQHAQGNAGLPAGSTLATGSGRTLLLTAGSIVKTAINSRDAAGRLSC
jgi:signal transduction histidine kinase